MNLLALSDISQLEYLKKNNGDLLLTHLPMTQDLAVAHELERLRIPFLDEYSYLSAEDIEENWNLAHKLSETWQNHVFCDEKGSILSDLARQDLVWPFEICLNAGTVYRRILESDSVESLSGYWLPPQPIVRTGPVPVTPAANSLAQAVLRWLAEQKQIPIHSLQCSRPLSGEIFSWRVRQLLTGVPAYDRSAARPGKVVVMLETGLRANEQAVLEQHLETTGNYRLVRISPRELGPDGLFAASIHQTEFDAALQEARCGLATRRREYCGPHPEIFANPHLEFQFLRILDEIQVATHIGAAFGSVLDVLRPSLLILGHEAFTQERVLVRQAQERGIPTVSLFHGGLGYSAGWRGIVGTADHVFVWGEVDAHLLESYGVDAARIHAVGSLQYAQKFSQIGQVSTVGQVSDRRDVAKSRLGLPAGKAVVVFLTASVCSGFAAIFAHPPDHRKTWMELVRMIENRPDITFVIKPHPSYDHHEFYRRLTRRGPENLVFLESAILGEVLATAEVAVLVNYCTTAAFEAMLAGIPVVFLREAILPLNSREDSLKEHGSVPVSSVEELESMLDRLLQSVIARAAVLNDAKWVLRQYLGEKDRPILQRIEAVLNQVSMKTISPVDDRLRVRAGIGFPIELADAIRLLWEYAGSSAYFDAIRNLRVSAIGGSRLDVWDETNLFQLAYSLGSCAESAVMLLQMVNESLVAMDAIDPASALGRQQFMLIGFLTAMIHAGDSGQWKVSRSYAWVCLRQMPGAATRCPLFRRYLVRSFLAGSNRFLFTLSGLVMKAYGNWCRLRSPLYQKII